MRTFTKAAFALAALGLSAWMITAQDTGGVGADGQRPPRRGPDGAGPAGGPGGPRRFPPPPIIAALDTNRDGVIDDGEIANASAALRTLDKNGDGKLTIDELMGPRPPRREGAGPDHQGPPPGAPGDGQPHPPQGDQ